jgi:hypothetical protein
MPILHLTNPLRPAVSHGGRKERARARILPGVRADEGASVFSVVSGFLGRDPQRWDSCERHERKGWRTKPLLESRRCAGRGEEGLSGSPQVKNVPGAVFSAATSFLHLPERTHSKSPSGSFNRFRIGLL